jgi:hypothetical protein
VPQGSLPECRVANRSRCRRGREERSKSCSEDSGQRKRVPVSFGSVSASGHSLRGLSSGKSSHVAMQDGRALQLFCKCKLVCRSLPQHLLQNSAQVRSVRYYGANATSGIRLAFAPDAVH